MKNTLIAFLLSLLFIAPAFAQYFPGAFQQSPTFTTVTSTNDTTTTLTNSHQIASGTALSFGVNGTAGAGAGTTPTITITGHDQDFQVSVTTGTAPSASSAILTITYATAFTGNGPYSQITPANANSAAIAATAGGEPYITNNTTTAVINAGTTALTASTQYIWNVHSGQ